MKHFLYILVITSIMPHAAVCSMTSEKADTASSVVSAQSIIDRYLVDNEIDPTLDIEIVIKILSIILGVKEVAAHEVVIVNGNEYTYFPECKCWCKKVYYDTYVVDEESE